MDADVAECIQRRHDPKGVEVLVGPLRKAP
jgi:hypothetical protein